LTKGTGFYLPSGEFTAPRSYYQGIVFDISGYVVFKSGDHYLWVYSLNPDIIFTIRLDPKIAAWNQNTWPLQNIVLDFYHVLSPTGTHTPDDFTLRLCPQDIKKGDYLLFQFGAVDFGEFHSFDFEASPSDYWTRFP